MTDAAQSFAFSAYPTRTIKVEQGATIKFDSITSNIGNHYNPVTGHFTCPETGIYAFLLILTSHYHNQVCGNLVKEGNTLAFAIASNPKLEGHHCVTASYLHVECQEGERIWVECYKQSVVYGGTFSTFSGHFLGTH